MAEINQSNVYMLLHWKVAGLARLWAKDLGVSTLEAMMRFYDTPFYAKLEDGYVINKSEEAQNFGVNERSIQRDIDDIRSFLDVDSERTGMQNTVIYDREQKGYRLEALYHMRLSNSEVLALCKILLDSRAFTKNG